MPKITQEQQQKPENIAINVAKYTIKILHDSKKNIPCSVHVVGEACIISFDLSEYTMPIAELIYSMPRAGQEVCYFECKGNIKPLLEVINLINQILNKSNAQD